MDSCYFAFLQQVEELEQLQQEMLLLAAQPWCKHVNQRDYQGDWDVLPLRCAAEHQKAHPILQSFSIANQTIWQDLPALQQSPVLHKFIQNLPCEVKSVRLMRLQPGAVIKPHKDEGLAAELGEARLHLPLQSDEELYFYVAGHRVPMQPGELWYINANETHWVEHKGQHARINLVIDCVANAWLSEQITAGRIDSEQCSTFKQPQKQQQLANFGQQMLLCQSASAARLLITPMLDLLCQLGDIQLHPEFFTDTDATLTAHGKAVSTTTAAQCAEDSERSRVFIQGIFQAISDQLVLAPNQPVRLLYAGTGPFGWLLLPLLPLFSAAQLQLWLLDIHPQSLACLRRLIRYFSLSDRVAEIICADATNWQPEPAVQFDLIVSETMKHLLQQEPQLAICCHLQQFLAAEGVFIPEDIRLAAWLQSSEQQAPTLTALGTLFNLNLNSARQLASGDHGILTGILPLPAHSSGPARLKLTTDIQVYKNHLLTEAQSQLTLPRYKDVSWFTPGSQLSFCYQLGPEPDFVFDYPRLKPELAPSADLSCGGVFHLLRLWQKCQPHWLGLLSEQQKQQEWALDTAVLDACGIGLENGLTALYQYQQFDDFKEFISPFLQNADIELINRQLKLLLAPTALNVGSPPQKLLSEAQLLHWQQYGYLVVPALLSPQQCAESCAAIWQYLQASPDDKQSWYPKERHRQNIMLQLFRHPALDANRQQPLLPQIFAELWQRTDLVVSTDRVSFNPPETAGWRFPGPDLHWDLPLKAPVPFGTQALIYLTDTTEEQGAFCCVPGFHLEIERWLAERQGQTELQLQQQHWSDWPVKAIAAKAGDLIIWHHALPHGASANKGKTPRLVQYINMYPVSG